MDIDWKEEMDKLMARTTKNWWKTGNRKFATGVTGSLELGSAEDTKDKKTLDKCCSI